MLAVRVLTAPEDFLTDGSEMRRDSGPAPGKRLLAGVLSVAPAAWVIRGRIKC
jgi:hypothetical protein